MTKSASERREIKVLLVDDQDDVLEGLKSVLETEPGLSIVGFAKNGLEALAQAEKLLPQVVVMDVKMPKMDGLEATRLLKSLYPEMRVILLSMYENEEFVRSGREAGASNYLLKGSATDRLIDAIKC